MTAIIVNDRGEVFVRWALAVALDVAGCESYYSVPVFGRTKIVTVGPMDLRPHGLRDGDIYTIDSPYVFSSEKTAAKSMSRIYGCGKLAVVS